MAVEAIKEHEWFWKVKGIILSGSFVERRFHLFSDIERDIKKFIKAIKLGIKDENGNNKHSKLKWGSQANFEAEKRKERNSCTGAR